MRVTTAYVEAALGARTRARSLLAELPEVLDQVPVDSEYLATLAQAARVAGWVGDATAAATLYERLLPHRDRWVVEGIGAYVHGSVERFLGILAGVVGLPERDQHFEAARALHHAAGAELLVRLVDAEAGRAPTPPSTTGGAVFRRDGDVWLLALDGHEARIRDSKGLRDLATLVARPREEVAAVVLAGRTAFVTRGSGAEMLDRQAKEAYRSRLRELDAEIADAEDANDLGRLDKATVERDFLVAELTRAVGLGGRSRRSGDDVERARTAVTARIRDAIRRIEQADATLGDHFRRSVRTGTYCTYDPAVEVHWQT
jgi:hypothetical protein